MSMTPGKWTLALDGKSLPPRELIGGKAWSIAHMQSLGLRVPPAFVVSTRACTEYVAGGELPPGLEEELAQGIEWLEAATGRQFGRGPRPLLLSVRSGAPISMPGMMDTVLNLGINPATARALAAECKDPAFADDTQRRFIDLYTQIVLKAPTNDGVPVDVLEQLRRSVRAVLESWNSRRARRYRDHHNISHQLGTAVTVQAMVFGNIDDRSGTGVLFSRNPVSGEPEPFGEFLCRAQGEDIVSGRLTPQPVSVMRDLMPEAYAELMRAQALLEKQSGDVQDIEFTVESGRLYLLQSRTAKRSPRAAVRIAMEMFKEGRISAATALRRVTAEQVRTLLAPKLAADAAATAHALAGGEGASPGIGIGVVVDDADEAERRGKAGENVVLARPTTSPNDLHGMLHARAIVTEQGGSTSHAAVVGRALGLPCVVGCGDGALRELPGRVVTVDGQAGRIYAGELAAEAPHEEENEWLAGLLRLAQAHSPIKVHCAVPDGQRAADLSVIPGAEDPEQIGAVLANLRVANGAFGGAIATAAGVRAALGAHLEFIVASPRLPVLLDAIHSAAATERAIRETET